MEPPSSSSPRSSSSGLLSLRRLRQWHLYLGVFFAPLLVFFVATGWYQVVNRDRLKDPSEAETLAQKFRVVHTDQIYPAEMEFRKRSSPKLFSGLVGVMSAAVILTTVLGLVLAFRSGRTFWPVTLALALGLLLPVLLLWAGHQS